MSLSNTLRSIAKESKLDHAEKVSLRLIAKEFEKLQAEVKRLKEALKNYGSCPQRFKGKT